MSLPIPSAFTVSFIAWILTFVAFAGSSSDPNIIKRYAWAKVAAQASPELYPPNGATIHSYSGIYYRVDETVPVSPSPGLKPEQSQQQISAWADSQNSCKLGTVQVEVPSCQKCGPIVSSCMISCNKSKDAIIQA